MISNLHWFRFFKPSAPLLVVAVFEHEVAYLMRRGTHIIKCGVLSLPMNVIQNQRLMAPEQLIDHLKEEIDIAKLDVAVVLPTALTHLQYLTLPSGLNWEERDYQVTRHISQTLGLSISEVFYDFSAHSETETMLAVARQAEVTQYRQAFTKAGWQLRWICPEQQVWASLYKATPNHQQPSQFICQVEYDRLQMWWSDEKGYIQHQSRHFDASVLTQAGFIYRAPHQIGDQKNLQLPTKFAVDEIGNAAKLWLGKNLTNMSQMLCTGSGLDWANARPALESHLGLSAQPISTPIEAGNNTHLQARLGIVWQLSQMIIYSSSLPLNLWPTQKKQPQSNSFFQEAILAGLLTLLVLACGYAFGLYAQNKTNAINQALEIKLAALNASTGTGSLKNGQPASPDAAPLSAITEWKMRSAGQLDWMLALNDLSNPSIKFTEARQENKNVIIVGIANSPQSVATLIEQLKLRATTSHHVHLSQIISKNQQTQERWQFSIEIIHQEQTSSSTSAPQGAQNEPA